MSSIREFDESGYGGRSKEVLSVFRKQRMIYSLTGEKRLYFYILTIVRIP